MPQSRNYLSAVMFIIDSNFLLFASLKGGWLAIQSNPPPPLLTENSALVIIIINVVVM